MAISSIPGLGRRLVVGALLLLGAACRKNHYQELVNYTFEDNQGAKGLSTDQAHSGTRSVKAVGPSDTLLLRLPATLLSPARHVRLGAQVWVGRSATQYPPLRIQVWRDNSVISNYDLWLYRVVWRYEQWVPVSMQLALPELKPTDELRLVLPLNQPDFKVYLDDLTLDNVD